jgi:hypothetical protein
VRALQQHGVPQESSAFLGRSDSEARTIAQHFGVTAGTFVGMAVGMSRDGSSEAAQEKIPRAPQHFLSHRAIGQDASNFNRPDHR